MNKFEAAPFTNELGQTINIGDRIICVSTGYSHRISVREGVYTGLRINSVGEVTSVQARVKSKIFGRWWPDGRKASYLDNDPSISGYEHRLVDKLISFPRKRIFAIK